MNARRLHGPGMNGGRVLGCALALALAAPARSESFLDWIRRDRQQMKEYQEGKKPQPPPEKERTRDEAAEWLIMVYGAGDNNLDEALVSDVREMESVGSSDRVKIVALMDRASGSEWSTARRFLVRKPAEQGGKNSWDPSLPTCQDLGEINTGDPRTLKAFMEWALQTYPASKTMLVLWNHGGGWREHLQRAAGRARGRPARDVSPSLARVARGVAWDDTNDGDFLETREVRQVLETLPKLSVIGADACLMAMIEVAYEWRERAEFFVGSEHLEPGDGWPYDTILRALTTHPGMSPRDLAAQIVKLYGESYPASQSGITQSAVDLSKVQALAGAWDQVAGELAQHLQAGKPLPDSFRRYFESYTFQRNPFLDFKGMIEVVAGEPAFGAAAQQAAQRARQAFGEAVAANHSVPPVGSGLSIYAGFTQEFEEYNADIIQFARDTRWDESLRLIVAAMSQPQTPRAGPAAGPADWLIMVYQAGDNNLDEFAVKDVKEMEKVGSSDRVKITVLMDRLDTAEWATARRFLVRKPAEQGGKNSWDPSLDTCEDLGEVNMGDPRTLRDFVAWSLKKYPAQRTLLVLWNHGGGWRSAMSRAVGRFQRGPGQPPGPALATLSRGICWDDTNDGDFLESREVRAALEGLGKLSIIGADACLMAMIECAYEWRDLAELLIASEEIEPGDGWPYDTILARLAAQPDLSPKDLSALIVSLYGESYGKDKVTLSAVSLPAIEPLAKAVDQVAAELMRFVKPRARFALAKGKVAGFPAGSPEFFDLDGILEDIAGNDQFDAAARQAAEAARGRLKSAVVANFSHAALGGRGLSIYAGGGQNDADYRGEIILFARDTRWDDLLKALGGAGGASAGAARKPERWAVLIGVRDYQDARVPDLQFTLNDVERLREALVQKAGYAEDHVIVLTEKQATTEKVRSVLGTELRQKAAPEDLVMVYFSGHGAAEPSLRGESVDGTEKYMLLADSRLDDLYGTALPMSELSRIFGRIQADKILFIMDACYSGAAGARGVMREGMRSMSLKDDYLSRLASSQGTVVITAARANEVSMESPRLKHGVFTYYLLQVFLGKADANGDGITTLAEAFQYLVEHVLAESKSLGVSQNPVMKGEVSGEFPIAVSAP